MKRSHAEHGPSEMAWCFQVHVVGLHVGLVASQLGAQRMSYVMLCATGSPADADLYLSDRQWRNVMDRIDRIAEALRIKVSVPEGYCREQPWHVCAAFSGQQVHVDVLGRVNLTSSCPRGGSHDGIRADGWCERDRKTHRCVAALARGEEPGVIRTSSYATDSTGSKSSCASGARA